MYYLSRPTYTSRQGCLGDMLNFHQLSLRYLMPCLVHAYIGAFLPVCTSVPELACANWTFL